MKIRLKYDACDDEFVVDVRNATAPLGYSSHGIDKEELEDFISDAQALLRDIDENPDCYKELDDGN